MYDKLRKKVQDEVRGMTRTQLVDVLTEMLIMSNGLNRALLEKDAENKRLAFIGNNNICFDFKPPKHNELWIEFHPYCSKLVDEYVKELNEKRECDA